MKRRVVLDLFWMVASFGAATIVMLAAACLARAETPTAPVLLAFQADWCGACRQMGPTVDALDRDGYNIHRVDVDRNRDLATRFRVNMLPCFIVVERGKEIDRIVGQTSVERLKMKLPKKPAVKNPKSEFDERRPSPAWRYEKPVAHRAAVVRIYCRDDVKTRSIGSGTLVKWGRGKIVVLTARHVIKDAKQIIVELCSKKTYWARVLKADATWDCAVLEIIGKPEGVEAVDLELGDSAMQREGNRLESCGYGPDGRLASNSGLFVGYRRSTETPAGPDDWFEISGHARPGDSGGPVFNERGRLVGVLWGTNGQVVVGVQAGRLHVLLDAAEAKMIDQRSFTLLAYDYDGRFPTPPKPLTPIENLPVAGDGNCCPGGTCDNRPMPGPAEFEPASAEKKPMLPWRNEAQRRDDNLDARTRDLLQAIEAEHQARLAREAAASKSVEKPKVEAKPEELSPLLAGLCVLGAIAVGMVVYFTAAKS